MNQDQASPVQSAGKKLHLHLPQWFLPQFIALSPLEQKIYAALADLIRGRKNWRTGPQKVAEQLATIFNCEAPHKDSMKRCFRQLKAKGILVCAEEEVRGDYRMRLKGQHDDFEDFHAASTERARGGINPPGGGGSIRPGGDQGDPPGGGSGRSPHNQTETQTKDKPPSDPPSSEELGGGENEITQIQTAWQGTGKYRVTQDHAQKAIEKAEEANPNADRATVVAALIAYAGSPVPAGINCPILLYAGYEITGPVRKYSTPGARAWAENRRPRLPSSADELAQMAEHRAKMAEETAKATEWRNR